MAKEWNEIDAVKHQIAKYEEKTNYWYEEYQGTGDQRAYAYYHHNSFMLEVFQRALRTYEDDSKDAKKDVSDRRMRYDRAVSGLYNKEYTRRDVAEILREALLT